MTINCTRSHPHEDMDEACEHKSDLAILGNQLAHAKAEIKSIRQQLAEAQKDALERYRKKVLEDAANHFESDTELWKEVAQKELRRMAEENK